MCEFYVTTKKTNYKQMKKNITKVLLFILFILISVNCTQTSKPRVNNIQKNDTSIIASDTIVNNENKYLLEFLKLRNYIYKSQKDSIEHFFLLNNNNHENSNAFWYLALAGHNDSLYQIKSSTIFTKRDFDKYFNNLFSQQFIKSLLKIRSKELFENGIYSTVHLFEKEDDGCREEYWIDAVFDKKSNNLKLQYNNYEYNDNDRIGESLIEYDFIYDKDCNLKFYKLILAG